MESFQDTTHIHSYKRSLGMQYANYNTNGQIWVFIKKGISVGVVSDTKQQLSLQLTLANGYQFLVTMVYAKCTFMERFCLWDDLYSIGHNLSLPWIVEVTSMLLRRKMTKLADYLFIHKSMKTLHCGLTPVSYLISISQVVLSLGGMVEQMGDYIFKRLDRVVTNQALQDLFGQLKLQHLARTGSDHAPLLLTCGGLTLNYIKPFRFLKFGKRVMTF